jgi:hypothetical protein
MEKTVYIIGDIHGCYDPLMELEELIHTHATILGTEPFIVSVGDLIDRGVQSREVVRHFYRGVRAGTHRVVAGNHEAVLFELLQAFLEDNTPEELLPQYIVPVSIQYGQSLSAVGQTWDVYREKRRSSWLRQGGRETLTSFGIRSDNVESWLDITPELQFLARLPMFWESSRTIVTHALASADDIGYARALADGSRKLDRASQEHNTHIGGLLWNRERPVAPVDPARLHISGHTPNIQVVHDEQLQMAIIDTACVYGNKLTAWCEQTGEILKVAGPSGKW